MGFSRIVVALGVALHLASCTPLPPTIPFTEVAQQDSLSRNHRLAPLTSDLPNFEAVDSVKTTTQVESISPSAAPFAMPLAPEKPESLSSALPSFDSPGRFERVTLPAPFHRLLRVGLGEPKASLRIGSSGFWSLRTQTKESSKQQGYLQVTVYKGRLQLKMPSGTVYASESSVVVTPWNGQGHLLLDGKAYRGNLRILLVGSSLRAINEIDVEDYLKGVVPHEIGRLDSLGIHALEAQAVAARTYAYRHFDSRNSLSFDVYDDVRDQVYEGMAGEYEPANRAIDRTAGVVLQYQGKLIEAYYHSTCGGHSESVEVWDRPALPVFQARPDMDDQGEPWCKESGLLQWTWDFTSQQMNQIVRQNMSLAKPDRQFAFQEVQEIMVLDRYPGGRVESVLVSTEKGTFIVKGDRTRWLFKHPKDNRLLPSAWFNVTRQEGKWFIRGKGFGHGIGMCQMGARGRSRAGQDYKTILWQYYPGASLVKWERP